MKKSISIDHLFEAVLTLNSVEECYTFFDDACTEKEIKAIAQRFEVAKMLFEKKVYSEIVEKTGASTATISRVNRSINDGYTMVFERLKK